MDCVWVCSVAWIVVFGMFRFYVCMFVIWCIVFVLYVLLGCVCRWFNCVVVLV